MVVTPTVDWEPGDLLTPHHTATFIHLDQITLSSPFTHAYLMPTDKRDQIILCNPAHLQKEGYDYINLSAQLLYILSL